MDGQSAGTRAQSAVSKSDRKKSDKNIIKNLEEQIEKLTRRLNRKVKRIAKLEHSEIEHQNQYSLQHAYLQEKLDIKHNKIVKLKKENRKKRQLAIENENLRTEIETLKQKNSRMSNDSKKSALKDKNANSTSHKNQNQSVIQSRSVSHRIQEVIEEIENQYPSVEPPSDSEIKETVLEFLHGANWDTTTMGNLIEMTWAKYSQFDLRAKKDYIRSIVRAAASARAN